MGRGRTFLGIALLAVASRYECEAPGELLHMDTKKLGRIVRPSHLG